MLFIISLFFSCLFLVIFQKAIKKAAWAFYFGTIAIIVYCFAAYFMNAYEWWPEWFMNYFVMGFARGALSTAFFAVVMYLGVVEGKPRIFANLRSIRAEISILGCFMALSHNIYYGMYYFPNLLGFGEPLVFPYDIASVISLILIAIMIPLTITSFKGIRKKMKPASWKKLQKTAYVFYALLYVHIMIVMISAVIHHINEGYPYMDHVVDLIAYSAVFIPYFILRPLKHFKDKRRNGGKSVLYRQGGL